MGIGGNRFHEYTIWSFVHDTGMEIPVYIQSDREEGIPYELDVTREKDCQWGMTKDRSYFWIVVHDKRMKPYQNRFAECTPEIVRSSFGSLQSLAKATRLDWILGNYLNNF
eukprot:CAMPEP_0184316224 /NCGR_PEP_ID=MMETSP1049-20130417/88718_1 /TAXON_ID=77928 /ORGANISM="Proteomonas sulcata, Strain CCMP704" /LENGTH=110 /DNA_ID=CAMNT_0026635097 /DNA_START=162 /DNA_END=494 /DNA_ORIENTATION=-